MTTHELAKILAFWTTAIALVTFAILVKHPSVTLAMCLGIQLFLIFFQCGIIRKTRP